MLRRRPSSNTGVFCGTLLIAVLSAVQIQSKSFKRLKRKKERIKTKKEIIVY
jgi:hypothetical protein